MENDQDPMCELLPVATSTTVDSTTSSVSSLHKDVFRMVTKQLQRSDNLDLFLSKVEAILFSDETIQNLRSDPESLAKIYSKAFYYKNQADNMVVKVMELSSKNDLIKKFLASVITEQGSPVIAKPLSEEDSKKVKDAVLSIKRAAISIAHGT